MHVRGLRQPRVALALTLAVVSVGVFSSSVGIGALPTSTLPIYGVTNGDGSRATVAELGDTNGDGIGDYAVGLPNANGGSGVVYVFLGHPGALSPAPAAVDLGAASFTITGHGGELLGYAVAGDDVNGDGLSDIAIGAPAAGAPSKADGGAVYVAFGSRQPQSLASTQLYPAGYTNNAGAPATPSPYGSRYDSFGVSAHTGMSLAALPDVNGDGYRDIAVGSPDTGIHRPGEGNVAVLYGKPRGVHINLSDLWEAGYPYYFHIDFPALDDQHVGESVASVGDVTGDGWPDLAIGAPQADNNGLADSGSVWIISGHLPPIDAGCSMHMVDDSCPWLRLKNLTAAQGYRIDGAHAGDGLGSSLAGVGDQNGDGIADVAIGASAASPGGRSGAGEVVVVQGQHNLTVRNLATTPPLETFSGARGGRRPRRVARSRGRRRRRWPHRHGRRRPGGIVVRRNRLAPARRAGRERRPGERRPGHRAGGSGRADRQRRGRGLLARRRRRRHTRVGAGHTWCVRRRRQQSAACSRQPRASAAPRRRPQARPPRPRRRPTRRSRRSCLSARSRSRSRSTTPSRASA